MPAGLIIVVKMRGNVGKTHTNLLCEDKGVFIVVAPVDLLLIPGGKKRKSFGIY